MEWRREKRETEREKKKKITKKKERIVTTILSLFNIPNLCLTSRTYTRNRRETRFLVAVYRVRRARIGEKCGKKGRGSEVIVSLILEYPRGSRRFSWICRVKFVPPIFRQRKNRPLKFRAWIRRNTLPIQPRLTTDYRAVVVSWRRYTWRARRSDIERALWPDRSDPVTTGRSDDRTRYLFSVPGNQRP